MQDAVDAENNGAAKPRFRPVPWSALESPADVELWIEEHNLALKEHIAPHETGYGVCFTLAEGGTIHMQTSADGAIILDVDAEADWVAPLIAAVAQAEPPQGAMWVLPDDKLVQLIMGLSSLIATSTLVAGHHFGRGQRRRY
ncbi:hypothetical protein [Pseudoduganella aquatica]|uniref:Uncharacterized protein n=1 Tax=Pseudoduganella aquatica TaxID=2660641 RepID=A0A7X4H9E9_9BURK|nr:hypothetical protein [Pseudoduganella aquatica]MYN06382.1 hypothetical protein [Pseudoduganella aquatica]